MSTPGSNPHRPVEDYDVDRLQVEARQRVKPSSTNWSCGLTPYVPSISLVLCHCHIDSLAKFPAAIAKGKHPFPFRTRKLSPSAPMVLHGRLCGRVGRRRDSREKACCKWAFSFSTPRLCPLQLL